jgi:hypothetical protein
MIKTKVKSTFQNIQLGYTQTIVVVKFWKKSSFSEGKTYIENQIAKKLYSSKCVCVCVCVCVCTPTQTHTDTHTHTHTGYADNF